MKGFFNTTHTNNSRIDNKQDKRPDGENELINQESGKIDTKYLPKGIGQGLKFAGTFDADGVITASAYAPELQGRGILGINLTECVGYEFQYTGEETFILRGLEINQNDIIVCNGDEDPNWTLIDNSDKVISVNGQTGAVNLDFVEKRSSKGGNYVAQISNADGEINLDVYSTASGSNKNSIKVNEDGVEIKTMFGASFKINGKELVATGDVDDARKLLILGATGTIGEKATFVVEDPESFIPYRKNLVEFVLSGVIPVTGDIDLSKEVTIDFGDTSYYLFSAVDTTKRLTLGDLDFALRESLVTGYNYLFRTVFFENADQVGFAVLPDKEDVLSLNSDQMDTYLMDGGLPQGQLAICKKVITNGYSEGGVYRFKITYPSTYEWEELSSGHFKRLVGDSNHIINYATSLGIGGLYSVSGYVQNVDGFINVFTQPILMYKPNATEIYCYNAKIYKDSNDIQFEFGIHTILTIDAETGYIANAEVVENSGNSGSGVDLSRVSKFVSKVYIDMSKATALAGALDLPIKSSSNFAIDWGDGSDIEFVEEATTSVSHTYENISFQGWITFYGDWNGIRFTSTPLTNNKKVIIKVDYDANIDVISDYSFYNCENLTYLYHKAIRYLDSGAVGRTSITQLDTKFVSSIGQECFPATLKGTLELPLISSLSSMDLRGLHGLERIYIPNSRMLGGITGTNIVEIITGKALTEVAFNSLNVPMVKTLEIISDNDVTASSAPDSNEYIENYFVPKEKLRYYKTATNWVTVADKIYPHGGKYSETITLPVSNWSGNSQTVEVVGSTAESRNNIDIYIVDENGKKIKDSYGITFTKGTMQMTFECETLPDKDLLIYVVSTLTNF